MRNIQYSFMERNDIQKSARVLSHAMLNNPVHIAIFKGNGENERLEIEKMFLELLNTHPGIVFVAKDSDKIVGVMRMKSCVGSKIKDEPADLQNEDDIKLRVSFWHREWSIRDPKDQHWHLGPIGVLPDYRGLGIGSGFMERFCREVDNCSAKAYLETDKDENVRFYEKSGFEVISKSDIFQVENRYMIRARQV